MSGNVLFFLKAIRQKYLGRRTSFVGGIAGKPGSLLLYHENMEGMHILWAFRLYKIFPGSQPIITVVTFALRKEIHKVSRLKTTFS